MRQVRRNFEATSVCYWPSAGSVLGGFAGLGAGFVLFKLGAFEWLHHENEGLSAALLKDMVPVVGLSLIGAFVGHRMYCGDRRTELNPYWVAAQALPPGRF